ncbi:hypothetical protein AVEN_172304-1 [Araneus ventricosus]|uniref:Uncharacterized protein n=1 Tax=Araneus ventricosus TaxID=182803 RepID=A0A4Y2E1K6_ARAVE|nr:hypothetical protein AVEN_172304-1 [Araneus ventricosus]
MIVLSPSTASPSPGPVFTRAKLNFWPEVYALPSPLPPAPPLRESPEGNPYEAEEEAEDGERRDVRGRMNERGFKLIANGALWHRVAPYASGKKMGREGGDFRR